MSMTEGVLRALRWKSKVGKATQDLLCNPDGSPTEKALILLKDLRVFCFVDCSSHAKGADGRTDVEATFVAEGRRQVYIRLCELMEMDPYAVRKLTNGVSDA